MSTVNFDSDSTTLELVNLLTQRRRRRSLHAPVPDELTEGTVSRVDPEDRVTVEIEGGPPRAVAVIQLADAKPSRVQLDACGTGRVDIAGCDLSGRIDVIVGGQVLLTGHLPPGHNR